MIPIKTYYLTGLTGEEFYGQLDFYQYQSNDIFSFRFDFSGDRFNITKKNGEWVYEGGMSSYLENWIEELGEQVDNSNGF